MAVEEYDDDAALLAELETETPDQGEPSAEARKPSETASEPAEPGVPEGDDDEGPYGKRVQKRINQLTKKIREQEQATQFWQEKVLALEERTRARETDEVARELSQTEQQLTAQIEAARAAKRRAIEEGDIDAQMKADDQLLDLREQLSAQRRKAESFKSADADEPARPKVAPVAPDPTANLPDGTRQWLKENDWFMSGKDPSAAEIARLLDVKLQEEGYDPADVEMYQELDRRLEAAGVRKTGRAKPAAAAPPAQRPPRSPVAASSADGQGPAPAKPTRRITQDDLANMRKWGYDPRKETDRRAWLKRNDLDL